MRLSAGTATVAVVGALALGIAYARWRGAEQDQDAAGARRRAAGRAVWHARRVILGVGAFVVALGYLWIHGKGHG